ncbi:MAG: SAM-dependent methyltransferase [Holosporales bacterium]
MAVPAYDHGGGGVPAPQSLKDWWAAQTALYYNNTNAVGAQGAFTTAPEISPLFGESLAVWLALAWERAGSPARATLAELGPGRGTLMADIYRRVKALPVQWRVVALENSIPLRAVQSRYWKQHGIPDPQWMNTLESLPTDQPMFVLANEFFDALPIEQWRGQAQAFVQDGNRVWLPQPDTDDTSITEISPVRVAAMNHLCTIVQKSCGAGLIIDYGAMRWQPGDSLQALRKHQSVNPFTADADTDITSHVNFEELHAIAKAFNLTTTLTHQRDFLHHHGIRERLSVLARNNPNQQESLYQGYARLVNPDDMGSIFKALEIYAAVQIPAAKNTPS